MTAIRRFGDYEIDQRLFQIRRAGEVVRVERRVFDLIAYLLANSNRVVSREELFREVWSGRVVSSGSLTVAINAARRVFRDDAKQSQVIVTHRGRGYRFHVQEEQTGATIPSEQIETTAKGSFVGRVGEIDALEEMLRSAAAGRAGFVCIAGEPGVGKTRLTEEFAAIARTNGALVAIGRCREDDGAPPFWPWIQVARSLCEDDVVRSEADALVKDAPEIARLVPAIAPSVDRGTEVLPPANARFRLFDGYSRFLMNASRHRCLLIVLDDAHRADQSSLLLMQFLLREIRHNRMLIVAAHRLFEPRRSQEQVDQLGTITREAGSPVLQLPGLSRSEISRLVRASTGWSPTGEELSSLQELTGGNPFFIAQVVPLLRRDALVLTRTGDALPITVRDAIARQIDMLTEETASVLKTASVIGREFESWLLNRLTGELTGDLNRVLAEATRSGTISSIDSLRGRWRFSHALVRDALYHDLERSDRGRVHAQVAEILEEVPALRSERLEEVTHHFIEAVEIFGVDDVLSVCKEAACAASASLAYEKAAEHYTRALQLVECHRPQDSPEICSILVRLGEEQVRCGDREAAKRTLDRAGKIAKVINSPELVAQVALGVAPGFFTVEAGVRDEFLISLLRLALSAMGREREAWRALVSARLAVALVWSDACSESVALAREASEIAEATGDESLRLVALLSRWLAEWDPYAVDRRRELATEAVAIADGIGSKEALAIALLYRCVGELEAGEIAAFDLSVEEFRSSATALRQPQALWYAHLLSATRLLHSGQFLRAEEDIATYFELGRRVGDANAFHSKMAQGLLQAAERGDDSSMLSIAEEARRRYPIFLGWRAGRVWALARASQVDLAQRSLDDLLATNLATCARKLDWPTALVVTCEAARLLERPDAAEVVYNLLLPLSGRVVVLGFCVMTWGPASRYLGLACETMGRLEEAEKWFQQAIDEGARSEGFAWLAHAEGDLFRVKRKRGGKDSELRDLRSRALRRASSLGMVQLSKDLATD